MPESTPEHVYMPKIYELKAYPCQELFYLHAHGVEHMFTA